MSRFRRSTSVSEWPLQRIIVRILHERPRDYALQINFPRTDDGLGRHLAVRFEVPDDSINPTTRMAPSFLDFARTWRDSAFLDVCQRGKPFLSEVGLLRDGTHQRGVGVIEDVD